MIIAMPPTPDYSLHQHEGVAVLSIELESLLSIIDVNRLSAEITNLVESGMKRMVLDLQKVKFAGSAALGMLLALSSDLRARGGKLVLANTHHIDPLLKVTRSRGVFTIATDTLRAMEQAKP